MHNIESGFGSGKDIWPYMSRASSVSCSCCFNVHPCNCTCNNATAPPFHTKAKHHMMCNLQAIPDVPNSTQHHGIRYHKHNIRCTIPYCTIGCTIPHGNSNRWRQSEAAVQTSAPPNTPLCHSIAMLLSYYCQTFLLLFHGLPPPNTRLFAFILTYNVLLFFHYGAC